MYPSQPPHQPPYTQPIYPAQAPQYPPMPPQAPIPYALVPYQQPYPLQGHRPSDGALIAEAALALFSIYGVGWLMSGKTGIGILLMGLGILWVIVAIAVSLLTGGLGACCVAPLHLIGVALSTILLSQQRITP